MLVRGVGVLVGHPNSGADAELDELSFEDLPAKLLAEVLLGQALTAHLVEHLADGDRAALLALGLRGDIGDRAVDFLLRDAEVGLVGLLLFQTIVDHPIEQLLVHLLLLHADDVRVVRLHADLDAPCQRPVQELGPQNRPLADDGDDTLDDGRPRVGRRAEESDERRDAHGAAERSALGAPERLTRARADPRIPLAVLEPLAGAGLAVLLALFLPRVARQEARAAALAPSASRAGRSVMRARAIPCRIASAWALLPPPVHVAKTSNWS